MSQPPRKVLEAFGVRGQAQRLAGGQGTPYRAGPLILKPTSNAEEATWIAQVYASLEPIGFRVPAPASTRSGTWVVDGWTAWGYIEGETVMGRCYAERLAASRAFHRALEGYAKPAFLASRDDPWSWADHIVWDSYPWEAHPRTVPVLTRLERLREPLESPEQIIHGDISGNLLLAKGRAPAVIDFSPYWRPAAYAEAIFIVDAVMWEGASLSELLDLAQPEQYFFQLLVRAAMRRLLEVDCHYALQHLPESYLEQINAYAVLTTQLETIIP